MRDLTPEILELVRLTSTDLPPDVEKALREALEKEEPGSAARSAMETIIANVEMARRSSTPICQDTGTPTFYVHCPAEWDSRGLRREIRDAVAQATRKAYLRPNAVDPIDGKNTGSNLGDHHFPAIHIEEVEGDEPLVIELILKGGGCENVSAQYALPDAHLQAARDLEGVRKATLHAVHQAQGEGCAPGFLGVAIGGDRGTSYMAARQALLHKMGETNPQGDLAALEKRITCEANELGIGPMGFGGKTTVLGTRITTTHRLPACFFVTVSYMCWAYRRRRMVVTPDRVVYE